jgi:subtilase family serine protease
MSRARHRSILLVSIVAAVAVPLTTATSAPAAPIVGTSPARQRACTDARPGFADCMAEIATGGVSALGVTRPNPVGWTPKQLTAAYGRSWSTSAGTGETIAIVDAYDSPHIEDDLYKFSKTYGLPTCTIANQCFTKINQNGKTAPLPATNTGWALEINLDVQWAHAMAPGAKIVLVEATNNSFVNLMQAEATAKKRAGVRYISNSWGAGEFSDESYFDSAWSHASNQTIFFSAGDSGATHAEWPSSAPNVVSVGGTTLTMTNGVASEKVWTGGGGGCSLYETAPAAQTALAKDAAATCTNGHRATPDLSAVADPNPGAGVYTTTPIQGITGWIAVGGTSLAAPVVAATAARSGETLNPQTIYGTSLAWRDITTGSNGQQCLTGFDLCSGRGTWIRAAS